jgi:hypothetical protein
MRKVHWVPVSSDKKIGPVLASYSPISSCPDSCSLKSGGCYAWGLFYLKVLSGKIESGKINPKKLSDALSNRTKVAKIARHRVAGDIVDDVTETLEECRQIEKAGLINIGYTHAWSEGYSQPLKKYFRASCNSLSDLEKSISMGWSPTVVVSGNVPKTTILAGKKAVLCPARIGVSGKKDITCNDCTLCKVSEKTKDIIIMFKAHGNKSTIKNTNGKVINFI